MYRLPKKKEKKNNEALEIVSLLKKNLFFKYKNQYPPWDLKNKLPKKKKNNETLVVISLKSYFLKKRQTHYLPWKKIPIFTLRSKNLSPKK